MLQHVVSTLRVLTELEELQQIGSHNLCYNQIGHTPGGAAAVLGTHIGRHQVSELM